VKSTIKETWSGILGEYKHADIIIIDFCFSLKVCLREWAQPVNILEAAM
jgi:hypothetical protein